MAALVIPRELANRFDLPPTCAISGAQREVEFRKLTLRHTPWWVWALGLLVCSFGANLLALLVVAGLGGRRATIELPFAPEAYGRWRRNEAMFHIAGLVCVGAVLASCVLAMRTADLRWFWVWLPAVVLAIGARIASRGTRLHCTRITGAAIHLSLPGAAARAVNDARIAEQAAAVPEGATCAEHADALASIVCCRCGSFACTPCREQTASPRALCSRCAGQRVAHLLELTASDRAWPGWLGVILGAGSALFALVLAVFPGALSLLALTWTLHLGALIQAAVAGFGNRTGDPKRRKLARIAAGLSVAGALEILVAIDRAT